MRLLCKRMSAALQDGHFVSWQGLERLAPAHCWEGTAAPSSGLRLLRGALLGSLRPPSWAIWCPCPVCQAHGVPSSPACGEHTLGVSQGPAVTPGPWAVFLAWPHQGQTLGASDSATWVGRMPHNHVFDTDEENNVLVISCSSFQRALPAPAFLVPRGMRQTEFVRTEMTVGLGTDDRGAPSGLENKLPFGAAAGQSAEGREANCRLEIWFLEA